MSSWHRALLLIWITVILISLSVSGFQVTRKGRLCETHVYSSTFELSETIDQNFLHGYDLVLRLVDTKLKGEVNIDDLDRSWCWRVLGTTVSPKIAMKPLHDCACAYFRPWIMKKVVATYNCDLPAGPQLAFLKKLKRKAKRYTQFIRFQLSLFRDTRAVKAFDDLMTSCFYNYIDEQILGVSSDSATNEIHRALPTPATSTNVPATPNTAPKVTANTPQQTQRSSKRPRRRKTPPPKLPSEDSTDGSKFASTTTFESNENIPQPSAATTVPPRSDRPATIKPKEQSLSTEKPTVTPVPTSDPISHTKDQGLTTTASSDTSQGISDRLANEFSEMSRQLSAMSGALMLILGLLIFIAVIGFGTLVWRSWRARSWPSDYQPLFPVYPSLGSPD